MESNALEFIILRNLLNKSHEDIVSEVSPFLSPNVVDPNNEGKLSNLYSREVMKHLTTRQKLAVYAFPASGKTTSTSKILQTRGISVVETDNMVKMRYNPSQKRRQHHAAFSLAAIDNGSSTSIVYTNFHSVAFFAPLRRLGYTIIKVQIDHETWLKQFAERTDLVEEFPKEQWLEWKSEMDTTDYTFDYVINNFDDVKKLATRHSFLTRSFPGILENDLVTITTYDTFVASIFGLTAELFKIFEREASTSSVFISANFVDQRDFDSPIGIPKFGYLSNDEKVTVQQVIKEYGLYEFRSGYYTFNINDILTLIEYDVRRKRKDVAPFAYPWPRSSALNNIVILQIKVGDLPELDRIMSIPLPTTTSSNIIRGGSFMISQVMNWDDIDVRAFRRYGHSLLPDSMVDTSLSIIADGFMMQNGRKLFLTAAGHMFANIYLEMYHPINWEGIFAQIEWNARLFSRQRMSAFEKTMYRDDLVTEFMAPERGQILWHNHYEWMSGLYAGIALCKYLKMHIRSPIEYIVTRLIDISNKYPLTKTSRSDRIKRFEEDGK